MNLLKIINKVGNTSSKNPTHFLGEFYFVCSSFYVFVHFEYAESYIWCSGVPSGCSASPSYPIFTNNVRLLGSLVGIHVGSIIAYKLASLLWVYVYAYLLHKIFLALHAPTELCFIVPTYCILMCLSLPSFTYPVFKLAPNVSPFVCIFVLVICLLD
jgi:hypothetical protein